MIGILYSTVGVVVTFGYLPQVYKLLRSQTPCRDISLIAWLIWDYTSIVSLLYSVFDVEDLKLSIVNSINVFFITTIILVTLYKRRKYSDVVMINETEDSLSQIQSTVEKVENAMDS